MRIAIKQEIHLFGVVMNSIHVPQLFLGLTVRAIRGSGMAPGLETCWTML